jgi:predicted ATPase/DNA-binding SARP family transcriptional activator
VLRGDLLVPAELWRGDKLGPLFTALLSAPGLRLSRDQAIQVLWPEKELANPASSFREVLAKLRRLLATGEPTLSSQAYVRNQAMQWFGLDTETVWIDAAGFSELAERAMHDRDLDSCQTAIDLYGGEYLPESVFEHLPEHHALIRSRRRALRNLYVELLMHAASLCENTDPPRAVEYYRRAFSLNPSAEAFARRYMAALAAVGELGKAQEVYGLLVRTLARQGVAPSKETAALRERLLGGVTKTPLPVATTGLSGLQMILAVAAAGEPQPALLAMIAAHGGVCMMPVIRAGAWRFAFPSPVRALAAAWALSTPPSGSAIPRGLRLALHTTDFSPRPDAAVSDPPLGAILAGQAHAGQVLLSRAAQAVGSRALPPGCALVALDRFDLLPGRPAEMVYQLSNALTPTIFPPLRAPRHRPHNLPVPLTSYLSRPRLQTTLCTLIAPTGNAESRLLTLTGVGGGGKTRLALHLAADLVPHFPGGVWFVDLVAKGSYLELQAETCRALGLREERDCPVLDTLVTHLRGFERPLLIILDNCEHVREAAARLAAALLAASCQVHILATSRERLGMQGERIEAVPSLTIPRCVGENLSLVEIARSEAVQLFRGRAAGVVSGFHLTEDNGSRIARICSRLDGIPLAIELAAAQLAQRSLEEISGALDHEMDLLAGGNAGAPERQQTLRATLDWSYRLLDPPSRMLFYRMGVFAGGCTLEAAQAVCAGKDLPPADIERLLHSLVRSSLLRAYRRRTQKRYRMLEPVRQYALEQLMRHGQGGDS